MDIFIVKTAGDQPVMIEDLGILIQPFIEEDLSQLFSLTDITDSDSLTELVANETLIVNNGIEDLSVANAINHLTIETSYEDTESEQTSAVLGSCQLRTTLTSSVPTVWEYIDFTVTDINTNVDIITTDQSSITLKEVGAYLIHYKIPLEESSTCLGYAEVHNNGTSISGSDSKVDNYYSSGLLTSTFVINTDATNIDLKLRMYGDRRTSFDGDIIFSVVELKGVKGNSGAVWHNGTGQPSAALGTNQDYFLRDNGLIYTKESGTWVEFININGSDAYTYTAYASDDLGSDFTTIFNPSLDYIAFRNSITPVVPDASFFTGYWKNYKGEKGDPGSGSSISIKLDDADVTNGVEIINFSNVIKSIDSLNQVKIRIPRGQAVVQRRLTSDVRVNKVWIDAVLDTVDEENNTNVLEADRSHDCRIFVKSSGMYMIHYHFSFFGSNSTLDAHVTANGTIIPGSEGNSKTVSSWGETNHESMGITCVKYLTANTDILLRWDSDKNKTTVYDGATLNITALFEGD